MKLNSLEANAHYDMQHGKPATIEADNDGSYLYRYNIEVENGVPGGGIPDEGAKEVQIGWKCREIRIWVAPTKAALKKAIIRSLVDDSAEFSIVNAYNRHVLGIKIDDSAVNNYKEYLQFVEDIDAMLIKDLKIN